MEDEETKTVTYQDELKFKPSSEPQRVHSILISAELSNKFSRGKHKKMKMELNKP